MWILAVFLSCILTTPAHAILITLEPDDYAIGTDVTHVFDGVTLNRYNGPQTFDGAPSFAPVVIPSFLHNTPATGTQAFGDFTGTVAAATCWEGRYCFGFSALLVQFAQPTNYVEVASSWGLMGGGDDQTAYAFDANHQLIQFFDANQVIQGAWRTQPEDYLRYAQAASDSHPDLTISDFASIVRIGNVYQQPMISSVILGGWDTFNTTDRISYNRVPEPSSWLMLALGLAACLFVTRRFRLS